MNWLSASGSWLRSFGRGVRMMRSVEEARAAASEALPDFQPIDAVVAEDGRAALALAADGRIMIVRTNGGRPAGREIDWAMLRQTPDGVVAETGDRRFGNLLLLGVTAIDVRRLGGSDAAPEPEHRELADA